MVNDAKYMTKMRYDIFIVEMMSTVPVSGVFTRFIVYIVSLFLNMNKVKRIVSDSNNI